MKMNLYAVRLMCINFHTEIHQALRAKEPIDLLL